MYETFYNLKEKPFNILPDPDYLYMSKEHENAYTHLEYAILENKGFVVVTGEIGSGKTTLINFLINKIQQNVQIGLINQTYVTPTQFIKMVCQDFELDIDGLDKAEMVDQLHDFLLQQFANNKRVILIIDEAQNLSPKTVEELRMLSNLEAEKHHLIQMILVGQPELKFKLQRKDLIQFAQRVTVNCHINALGKDEVRNYIQYRLEIGGSEDLEIFTQDAINKVYEYSRGIPRLINVLCDASLVYGYADKQKHISIDIVKSVVKERKAGGVFADVRESDGSELAVPNVENVPNRAIEQQVQQLSRYIRLMENRVDSIDQRISNIEKGRGGGDAIVLELLKMLKESLDRRYDALMSIKKVTKISDQNS